MNIEKKELPKSQVELTVELSVEEFDQYVKKGALKVSEEITIEGFRPGKAPYEMVKNKVGEMTILEEAARIAINKTIDKVIQENISGHPVGQPQISITKLAPNNPLEYKVVMAMLPTIELGDYKNAKAKREKVEISDVEIEKLVNDLREMRVKEVLVDREAKATDKVIADVNMYLDKIPVEGGQGKDTAVIIGREQIVPGFEKQLLGVKKDEVKEFSLPYPADHFQTNLAGKLVEFKVTVKEVFERQLPEPNDEFAQGFGLKKFEEFKDNIRKSLEAEKHGEADKKVEVAILDQIIESTKFGDLPDLLIENESRLMMHELEHEIESRGGKFDDYLSSMKKSRDEITLELLPNAIKRVKAALVIGEIARAEKIEVTEVEIDKRIEEVIKQYKGYYEGIEDRVKEPGYRGYLHSTLTNEKVVVKLKEWNVEKGEKVESQKL